MQGDAKLAQDLLSLRENVVEEKHEYMFDNRAGLAQRLAEVHLAAAVSRHVLDQEHAFAGLDMTLDLRVAAEALRLLAHILHRQHQAIRHPSGERNSSRLATGDPVELFEANLAHERRHAKINQLLAHARKGDKPPAVGIDRARPARRIDERLVGHEADSIHFE